MKIAFQGEHGAYSELAVYQSFGKDNITIPCKSFEEVFSAVKDGAADYGLIPVENSIAGSIHQNYDNLLEFPVHIIGEHFFRVEHCLISYQESDLEMISTVRSHPQALAQCKKFLDSLDNVEVVPFYDTAGAVKELTLTNDLSIATIASRLSAEIYQMKILKENIETDTTNYTRFLKIAKHTESFTGLLKTSMVYVVAHTPGSLYQSLGIFANKNLNLSKIESRPILGKPWEYFFYVDILSDNNEQLNAALKEIKEKSQFLKVFGTYPASSVHSNH